MAIFKMPFMYKLTQSMADNTYCRTRGKNVVKTKIDTNSSNTEKQQVQRLKMKQLMQLCKVFNAAIRVGFPGRPRDYTSWNAFVSANGEVVLVDDKMSVTINYDRILVAQGSREVVEGVTVVKDADAHTLTFSHEAEDFGYGAEPTDVLYAVVLEKQKLRSKLFRLDTRKDDTPVSVSLPAQWDMANLLVYVFVLSENGKIASDSLVVPVA